MIGLAVVWMGSAARPAWGQSAWPSYPNNTAITVTSGGNVGIGTTSPNSNGRARLTVATGLAFDAPSAAATHYFVFGATGSLANAQNSNLTWTRAYDHIDLMTLKGNGNVGIGTTSPISVLTINSSASATSSELVMANTYTGSGPVGTYLTSYLPLNTGTSALFAQIGSDNSVSNTSGQETGLLKFTTKKDGAWGIRMVVSGDKVGIGTLNPQYKLAVNGTIGTKEVIVTNTGWSDYVLRPGYRLRPLSDVGAYIRAHHHLPDIPSEAEVKGKGVSLGDMQARLLAKIEELTLYMIQQDKDNRELRQRIAQLETRAAGR